MLRMTGKHVVALAIVMVASVALVQTGAAEKNVGQFVQDLARVKNLSANDPQIAADSLAAAGLRLPAGLDFSASLTEGMVTTISRAAGLMVTASDPDAVFSQQQVDEYFAVFSNDLTHSGSEITVRGGEGDCVVDEFGVCAVPGADCQKHNKMGFCQPSTNGCNCNTGAAKGKRKQVGTPDEPE